jgi:hypothetical protein
MKQGMKRGRQQLPDDYLEIVRPQLERLRSTAVTSTRPRSFQAIVRNEATFLQELRALGHPYKDIAVAMSTDGYRVDPATLVTCISRHKADVMSATPSSPPKRTKPKKSVQADRRRHASLKNTEPTLVAPPVDKGGSAAHRHSTTTLAEDSPIAAQLERRAPQVSDMHANAQFGGTTDLFEATTSP